MVYEIGANGAQELKIKNISHENPYVAYVTLTELAPLCKALGLSAEMILACAQDDAKFRNSFEVYDECSMGVLNVLDEKSVRSKRDRVLLLVQKNLFLMLELDDEDGSLRAMFRKAVTRWQAGLTLEKVVYGVLDCLLTNGDNTLEEVEASSIAMEELLGAGHVDANMNGDIFALKTRLTMLGHYYNRLVVVGETLAQNTNGIFGDGTLRYFDVFTHKAQRLASATQALCEGLVHLREAYQAGLDYNVNKLMKLFTVVTTIFLPLTLIVGWYGMNFTTMPEFTWRYGYVTVISLSLAIVVGCLLYFRRKRWM